MLAKIITLRIVHLAAVTLGANLPIQRASKKSSNGLISHDKEHVHTVILTRTITLVMLLMSRLAWDKLKGYDDGPTGPNQLLSINGVLPWDLCLDGLVCPGGPTVIASPLCDVGSDSNRQKPERQKLMCQLEIFILLYCLIKCTPMLKRGGISRGCLDISGII